MDSHEVHADGVLQQFAEGGVAVDALGEGGALALHGVLDHAGPEHLLPVAHEGGDGLDQKLHGGALLGRDIPADIGRGAADVLQVLVVDELVAIVPEEVGRGLLHADADDPLPVLLEFGDQG